jgi:hypothetical protein
MTNITIVLEKSTQKIIPFEYATTGEIIISSTRNDIDIDDLVVKTVDCAYIDWDNMRLLSEPIKEKMEQHPFNLLYLP